jgi:oligopeptide/dipeptide ABC transporter ATP-binding protein
MNRDLGISIVYITHDLATAYQISDTIVVLYRGSVVEIGDVELVVKRPQHPYTQLLLSSIPLASPERTWMTDKQSAPVAATDTGDPGCKFAGRCPSVAASCRETAPSLFQTDRDRAVACYLYRGAPTVTGDHLQPRRSR